MNTITKLISFIIIAFLLIISVSLAMYSISEPTPEISEPTPEISVDEILKNYFSSHTIKKQNNLDFDTYFTDDDVIRLDKKIAIQDEVRFELSSEKLELYEKLTPNENTIVIYPIFTSAAYSDNGFYDFYSGDCDERCLVNVSFENPDLNYNSSGISTQILHIIGYDFITDIDVDKILKF